MDAEADLVARAESGEAGAQFALAQALLRATDTIQDQFFRAVSLVESASALGHAEATAMRALFKAMGVSGAQNWESAFDTLLLAAQQGSHNARRQLLFLLNSTADWQMPDQESPGFWAEARQGISVERLLTHGERRALSNTPRIRIIQGFASASECRWMIERASTMLEGALVFDVHGKQVRDPGRTNKSTVFHLPDMDLVMEMIRARISAATNIPVPLFEPTQVLHYSVGQEFKRHVDSLEPSNPNHREQLRSHGQRIATFLIYLNDDFEGGETEFSRIGLRYRGKMGDAIFWANCDMEGRPDPMTLHAGLPPTAGEKWILSQWIRDRAPPAA